VGVNIGHSFLIAIHNQKQGNIVLREIITGGGR
jgi:hypothetical protein